MIILESIDVKALPSVSLEQRLRLPQVPGIYFCLNEFEGILFTSTKVPTSTCVAIFTERMIVGSSLSVYDPRNELPEQNKVIKGLWG